MKYKKAVVIAITIDEGMQSDLFGGMTRVEIKRDCTLVSPTLFDYQRELQVIGKLEEETLRRQM